MAATGDHRQRVLIIDPSRTMRAVVRQEFDDRHFEVFEAGNTSQALALAERLSLAVVTANLALPDDDGHALCVELSRRSNGDVCIIIISADDGPGDKARAFAYGAACVVSIGFPPGTLRSFVEHRNVPPAQPDPVVPDFSSRRMILAEDAHALRALAERMLQPTRIHAVFATDGREAVIATERWLSSGTIPDAVILDLNMPELDGYGALKAIRDLGYGGPIGALTADTTDEARRHCLAAGFDIYLSKPFTRDVLYLWLNALFHAHDDGPANTRSAVTPGGPLGLTSAR